MRECIRHQMTEARLARFLAANGLRRHGNQLLAPAGASVGVIRQYQGGLATVLVFQEKHQHDGREVTAWWPTCRPAWTFVTGDGKVEVGDPLGPDEVICDLCNAEVAIRPVPVVGGYAHCAECFAGLGIPFPGSIQPYRVPPPGEDREADR